jgi:hypothetical protein
MIRAKIDVTKIDKTAIHDGKKGKYIDITLMDNRDGRDQYDNDGFVVQDLGKDRRLAGEKGPILGNWKDLDGGNQRQGRDVSAQEATRRTAPAAPAAPEDEDDSDIPF